MSIEFWLALAINIFEIIKGFFIILVENPLLSALIIISILVKRRR